MAEENTVKTEDTIVKPIIIKDKNTGEPKYVLEFDRASVREAEKSGFKIDSVIDLSDEENGGLKMAIAPLEDLFFHSFRKHQPFMNKNATNRILYDELCGMPTAMIARLVELYMYPFNTLINTDEESKNASLTIEM